MRFAVPPLKNPQIERFCEDIATLNQRSPAEAAHQFQAYITDNKLVFWEQLAILDRIRYLSYQKSIKS